MQKTSDIINNSVQEPAHLKTNTPKRLPLIYRGFCPIQILYCAAFSPFSRHCTIMASNHVNQDDLSDSSSASDPLDTRNDEGWEDVEPDEESITVVSLFDERTFPDAASMLAYCRDHHDFDIWRLRQQFGTLKYPLLMSHESCQY